MNINGEGFDLAQVNNFKISIAKRNTNIDLSRLERLGVCIR